MQSQQMPSDFHSLQQFQQKSASFIDTCLELMAFGLHPWIGDNPLQATLKVLLTEHADRDYVFNQIGNTEPTSVKVPGTDKHTVALSVGLPVVTQDGAYEITTHDIQYLNQRLEQIQRGKDDELSEMFELDATISTEQWGESVGYFSEQLNDVIQQQVAHTKLPLEEKTIDFEIPIEANIVNITTEKKGNGSVKNLVVSFVYEPATKMFTQKHRCVTAKSSTSNHPSELHHIDSIHTEHNGVEDSVYYIGLPQPETNIHQKAGYQLAVTVTEDNDFRHSTLSSYWGDSGYESVSEKHEVTPDSTEEPDKTDEPEDEPSLEDVLNTSKELEETTEPPSPDPDNDDTIDDTDTLDNLQFNQFG